MTEAITNSSGVTFNDEYGQKKLPIEKPLILISKPIGSENAVSEYPDGREPRGNTKALMPAGPAYPDRFLLRGCSNNLQVYHNNEWGICRESPCPMAVGRRRVEERFRLLGSGWVIPSELPPIFPTNNQINERSGRDGAIARISKNIGIAIFALWLGLGIVKDVSLEMVANYISNAITAALSDNDKSAPRNTCVNSVGGIGILQQYDPSIEHERESGSGRKWEMRFENEMYLKNKSDSISETNAFFTE